MINRKLSLVFITALFSLPAISATKHEYVLKTFTKKISMVFSSKEKENGKLDLHLGLKLKLLGLSLGSMNEITLSSTNFIPELDSRCRSPKRKGKKYNCVSSKYLGDSELLIKEFNAKNPVLNRELSASSENVMKINMKKRFPLFDINRDQVYNLTSLYFLTSEPGFGMRDHNRILYVTGSKELFKIQLKLTERNSNELDVTLDVLNSYVETEEGKYLNNFPNSKSTLPGKFIYNKSQAVVTELYLKTQKNTYELKLKR
ncbi:MAG: hypothetical protein HN576_07840 [Bacteriovoracaceae bacterium]|jgi:hypothetical protein|nr:hypothetical protein [Bacteriovoracaceae bacterium]